METQLFIVLFTSLTIFSKALSSLESTFKCGADKDSFINICGICVNGSTGLQSSEGLDGCAVCFGSDDCNKCNDSLNEGCKVVIFPSRIDLALDEENFKIHLQSPKIIENHGEVTCSLRASDLTDSEEGNLVSLSKDDTTPFFVISSSSLKIGFYTVKCFFNSSNDIILNSTFQVVDSRSLQISHISPRSVASNSKLKVTINVTLTKECNHELLCFAKVNGLTEYISKSKNLSSVDFECNFNMGIHRSPVLFGLSETLDAALYSSLNLSVREIDVHQIVPSIKMSTFSPDLRLILIQFDQNLDPLSDCKEAFSPETTSLFGKGWHCWIQANQVIVQLGAESIIHPGSRISLSPSNNIQNSGSNQNDAAVLHGSTAIVNDVTNEVIEPLYSVLAPHVVCNGARKNGLQSLLYARGIGTVDVNEEQANPSGVTILEVQHLGGQNLFYDWSVSFKTPNNGRSLSQRDMLMIWLSVRLLNKSLRSVTSNKASLNNSLMLSNVDYIVTVKGTNALGMSGEEKHIPLRLQDKSLSVERRSSETTVNACTSGSPLDVVISSFPATFCDTEFQVDVSMSCCNGSLNPEIIGQIGYNWTIKSHNNSEVVLRHFHQGKSLKIPSGTLLGGEHYNIICHLYHKTLNKSLATASASLVTLERGVQAALNVSAVGISTKHPLILDASASRDFDNKFGALEFEWSCRMTSDDLAGHGYSDNKCYTPSQEKTLIHDMYNHNLKKPILYLPPGSLPIGRYQFSVKVSRNLKERKPASSVKTAHVSVLGGSPPLVFIPSRNSLSSHNTFANIVNPDEGVTLVGVVVGVRAGCHINWRNIEELGYSLLNQSLLHQEPFRSTLNDGKPRESTLELPPGLQGDAKYRLRLSALCSSPKGLLVETSFADIDVITDAPPAVKPLLVDPLEGEALLTAFRFSTQPAYDDLLDYPLRYSFGFRIAEEGSGSQGMTKFFHSSNGKLSATTYLPALSLTTTRIQSVLKVCDVRKICHSVDGPPLISHAPTNVTAEHVELLSEGFSSFLMAEEYEDAVILVESNMVTLEVLNDKTLYQLASKRVETAVNSKLDEFEKRLDSTPEAISAALRLLKAANTALKHCAFSQETLQRLVAFKDKILSMLGNETGTLPDYQSDLRRKRQTTDVEVEQSRNVLQPDVVRTLLSVYEVAIFNLSDTSKALSEKRKLLQNVSFFMDSLCRRLHNSIPLFVGSRVVSFSVQRLNLQVKYKDDLAVPDWRSAKSGGSPVNATALIRLGENVQNLMGPKIVCMGAAYYPMDFLSEVSGISENGVHRHSSVYYVKIIQSSMEKITLLENYEGVDIKAQTIRIKIPIWSEPVVDGHLECRTWWHGTWIGDFCKLSKQATLINKPAVECQCSVVGYYAVFVVESPITTSPATTKPTEVPSLLPDVISTLSTGSPQNLSSTSFSHTTVLSTQIFTKVLERTSTIAPIDDVQPSSSTLSPGIPIPNTSQNFTFKIQEDFSVTVGSNQEAFIAQLKDDILKQVQMPANMIASIDIAPGSILVTLHLVDTDIRTVDDVLPSLAAALQDGRMAINGIDGRHLSVPPQSLQLLQRRTEQSFVPWIIVGCTGFGLFSVGSLVIAAIIVKRQLKETDYADNTKSSEVETKTASYGRFHLEETLDGSKATLSRYRSTVNNPLVVSTIGGLASVMGTNALLLSNASASASHYRLRSPQLQSNMSPSLKKESSNLCSGNSSSGNTSGSSGNGSFSSVHKRTKNGSILKQITLTEEKYDDMDCDPEEEDSGIVLNNGKSFSLHLNNSRSQTPESSGHLPDVVILPGTPTGRCNEVLPQTEAVLSLP